MIQGIIVAFILGAAIAGGTAWTVTRDYYIAQIEARDAAAIKRNAAAKADADAAMDSVVAYYEGKRNEQRERVRVIREQVERIIDRPVYRDCRVDPDGVRLFNDAAADVVRLGDSALSPGGMSRPVEPSSR